MVRGGDDKFGFVSSNSTPFEMVDFKFHVKAPIFVFRQWHRHRTFSINEYSARYSQMNDEMYEPTWEALAPQSTTNKQGREEATLSDSDYTAIMAVVDEVFQSSFQAYMHLLGPNESGQTPPATDGVLARIQWCKDAAVAAVKQARQHAIEDGKDDPYPTAESLEGAIQTYLTQNGVHEISNEFPGIARELARMVLPVATYSEMYWKGNLHNLFHFLNLRADSHAQAEIRVYAEAMVEMIRPIVPWSVEAWDDYLFQSVRLSRMEVNMVRHLISQLDEKVDENTIATFLKEEGCGTREVDDFMKNFVLSK